MQTELGDLIATLPEELREDVGRDEELRRIVDSLLHRPVPTGRLSRLWALGSLKAKVVCAYALCWARERFASPEEKEKLRAETHLRAAMKLLAGMGYLRGAIMKVGQVIGSYPDIAPEQLVELLSRFHFEAPPMHFSLLREQVRRELGADPEDVFAEFDTRAFAAASLGQVHRARLHTGEEVAVKIQYPGIGRTIASDMNNVTALLGTMRFLAEWRNFMDVAEELEKMLTLETDYLREADWAEEVREALADLDDIVVPRVHRELTSPRVLTLDYVPGLHPPQWLEAAPSREERDRRGTQILRATQRLFYSRRLILADPNPGNWVFMPDGRLGLLDFGCYRRFTEIEWEGILLGIHALMNDNDGIDETLQHAGLLTDEEMRDEDRLELMREATDWMWEPIRHDGPFDFGSADYLSRGIRFYRELVERRYTRARPVVTWEYRCFYGLRALLYSLGSRADMGRIHAEELELAGLSGA
jgi:predicted unusual protein kinase regulating ubiquinone biosynthesis (AarF/ABC1/UbiB family)